MIKHITFLMNTYLCIKVFITCWYFYFF